jgi:hypothetical protein
MHAGRDLKRHPHSPEAVPHHQTDPMAKCMVVERTQFQGTTQRNNVHIAVTSLHPLVSQCDFRMSAKQDAQRVTRAAIEEGIVPVGGGVMDPARVTRLVLTTGCMIANAPAPKVQQDMGMPGAGIPDL